MDLPKFYFDKEIMLFGKYTLQNSSNQNIYKYDNTYISIMLLTDRKIKMLECFALRPEERITASQIAKNHKLNQKSVYLIMEALEEDSILTSQIQGKNKLYGLNRENKVIVKQFLCAIEHFRTALFYQQHPNLTFIMQKVLPHVNGIALIFGSYAKNLQKTTSDLDVFIIGRYDEKKLDSIVKTFGIDVNIKRQKSLGNGTIAHEVKMNHILIKNTEQFISEANPWIN